jgi:protein tyrosine phosphatase (PTP) superfamily phosphohydrolase (DUF442 family)
VSLPRWELPSNSEKSFIHNSSLKIVNLLFFSGRITSPLMKKFRIFTLGLTASVLAGAFGIYDVFYEDRNFRIMQENEVYRSAQLEGRDWPQFYKDHPFRSVINLRGENDGKPWYEGETDFTRANGIGFQNLALSANREPDMATMEKLVSMMREAPKPLLIHCKQGADRSGLASALYVYAIQGKFHTEAARQLSIYYGHFPWFTSETGAMDRAFAKYTATHPH